jgi:glycosyltransferase involved in cell wall biosynthesis
MVSRLAVIVPATNAPATLDRCIAAIEAAADRPDEIVVVDTPTCKSPAAARNNGAWRANGDILAFVDADVEVHPDVFTRIRAAFDADESLTAIFGSYDDVIAEPGAVSAFRNLLHHHVHQQSGGEARTFWAGLGAIRRDAFVRAGGFVEHPVEDIELGMRLSADGARIRLDPEIQGTHLKRWTLRSMIRTDLFVRGIPWVGLLLRHRSAGAALNLGWRHRLSALACLGVLVGLVLWNPWVAGGAVVALVALNLPFYALLFRKAGPLRALAGIGLHFVHHLVGIAALPLGMLTYLHRRGDDERVETPPSTQP